MGCQGRYFDKVFQRRTNQKQSHEREPWKRSRTLCQGRHIGLGGRPGRPVEKVWFFTVFGKEQRNVTEKERL